MDTRYHVGRCIVNACHVVVSFFSILPSVERVSAQFCGAKMREVDLCNTTKLYFTGHLKCGRLIGRVVSVSDYSNQEVMDSIHGSPTI